MHAFHFILDSQGELQLALANASVLRDVTCVADAHVLAKDAELPLDRDKQITVGSQQRHVTDLGINNLYEVWTPARYVQHNKGENFTSRQKRVAMPPYIVAPQTRWRGTRRDRSAILRRKPKPYYLPQPWLYYSHAWREADKASHGLTTSVPQRNLS